MFIIIFQRTRQRKWTLNKYCQVSKITRNLGTTNEISFVFLGFSFYKEFYEWFKCSTVLVFKILESLDNNIDHSSFLNRAFLTLCTREDGKAVDIYSS